MLIGSKTMLPRLIFQLNASYTSPCACVCWSEQVCHGVRVCVSLSSKTTASTALRSQMHHLRSERQTSSARLLMSSPANAYLRKHFPCHVNGLHLISDLHAGKKKKWARISLVTHRFSSLFPTFPWLIVRLSMPSVVQHSLLFSWDAFFTWQGRAEINQSHAALMLSAYFASALTRKVQAAGGGGILYESMNFLPAFWQRGASIVHIL